MSKALAHTPVLYFNGVNSTATAKLSGNVSSLRLWLRLDSLTESIAYFNTDSSTDLTINAGTFEVNGSTSGFTVNVLTGSIEAQKTFEVEIVYDTPFSATEIVLGRTSSAYMDGYIGDAEITGTAAIKWEFGAGFNVASSSYNIRLVWPNKADQEALRITNVTWLMRTGKEDGETHSGYPQSINKNGNYYTFIQNSFTYPTGASGLLPIGSSARTFVFTVVNNHYTASNLSMLFTSGGNGGGQGITVGINSTLLRITALTSGQVDYNINVTPSGSLDVYEVSFGGTNLSDFTVKQNGASLTPSVVSDVAVNTADGTFEFNSFVGCILVRFEVYSDATKTTKTQDWKNLDEWENTVGASDLTQTVYNWAKIPEDVDNPGFDVLGEALKTDKDVSGSASLWPITNAYIKSISKTLEFNEGAIVCVIKVDDLQRSTERNIWDARITASGGLRLYQDSNNKLHLKYNSTSCIDPSDVTKDLIVVSGVFLASEMKLRVNATQVQTAAKSGSIVSDGLIYIGGAYNQSVNFFKGYIGDLVVLDDYVDDSTLESEVAAVESTLMTKYGIS